MNRSKLPLFLLVCLTSVPALAQQALTFRQCVTEASAHNLDLLAAEQTVKADEANHMASLGQFFPQITFNASFGRSGFGGLDDAVNGPFYNQNSSLSLNAQQDIFSGFRDFSSVDQSNAQLDLARAQWAQAKAQLSHDLKVDFYTLLYSQNQIDLLKEILDRQKYNMGSGGNELQGWH